MAESIVVVAGVYAVMSAAAAVVYAWDKRAARRGKRRIPEKTLHMLALFGGFPGALIAQQLFKHKRRKRGFVAVTWLIAVLHIAAWAGVWYLSSR